MPIPVAPSTEQRRIVAKVEELILGWLEAALILKRIRTKSFAHSAPHEALVHLVTDRDRDRVDHESVLSSLKENRHE